MRNKEQHPPKTNRRTIPLNMPSPLQTSDVKAGSTGSKGQTKEIGDNVMAPLTLIHIMALQGFML
jgi:hypothetical protein